MDKNRRRVLLINPRFQMSFILQMIILAFGIICVFYGANIYFFKSYLKQGQLAGLPADHVFFGFLGEQFQLMNWIFFITSLVAFSIIFVMGLYLSHKVAGPLYRLQKHLEELVEQEKPLSEVKFREGDYFRELEAVYNQHVKVMQNKIK